MVVGRTVKIVVLLWGLRCWGKNFGVVLVEMCCWGKNCGVIVVEMRCWGKNCGVVVVGLRFVLSKILHCCYTHAKTRLAHLWEGG